MTSTPATVKLPTVLAPLPKQSKKTRREYEYDFSGKSIVLPDYLHIRVTKLWKEHSEAKEFEKYARNLVSSIKKLKTRITAAKIYIASRENPEFIKQVEREAIMARQFSDRLKDEANILRNESILSKKEVSKVRLRAKSLPVAQAKSLREWAKKLDIGSNAMAKDARKIENLSRALNYRVRFLWKTMTRRPMVLREKK